MFLLLANCEDAFDQLSVMRKQLGLYEARRQCHPVFIHGENAPKEQQRLVNALHVHQSDRLPVDDLSMLLDISPRHSSSLNMAPRDKGLTEIGDCSFTTMLLGSRRA